MNFLLPKEWLQTAFYFGLQRRIGQQIPVSISQYIGHENGLNTHMWMGPIELVM